MTIKKLGLALAVSALASGANAALYLTGDDAGNTGGSSLLLAAYDAATATTLYVDLNALAPNMRVHTLDRDGVPAQSIDLSSVAAANNFSLANVQWAVIAGDNTFAGGACSSSNYAACGTTFMATVSENETLPATTVQSNVNSAISGINGGVFSYIAGAINTGNGHSTTVADGSNGQWINVLNNAQSFWDVTGTTGESLAFAMARTTSSSSARGAPVVDANGSFGYLAGTWTLSENSTLTYSAVPVPAALWMFASGLVGLAGVARRRKQA